MDLRLAARDAPGDDAPLDSATLLAWLTKIWVPPLQHLLAIQIAKAVERAETPLRARIRELEHELRDTRAKVQQAVAASDRAA